MRKLTALAVALIIVLSTGSCADLKSIGGGPWPILQVPKALVFTAEEAAKLTAFAAQEPVLFKKIQGQYHEIRATVVEYNKKAREYNKKKLEALGFEDKELREHLNQPKE